MRPEGVRVLPGVEVTGYDVEGGRVRAVLTNQGRIACDVVVWGLGAWTPHHWRMLGKPTTVTCRYPDGTVETKDMWTYWRLLEGEVYHDEPYLTAAGLNPPVLHVETTEPVVDPGTGRPIKDFTYVYFKNGDERMDRPGLQGGTTPVKLGPAAVTDPYGHANDEYQADPGSPTTSARRWARRCRGSRAAARTSGSGATAASARSRRTTCRSSTGWRRTSS